MIALAGDIGLWLGALGCLTVLGAAAIGGRFSPILSRCGLLVAAVGMTVCIAVLALAFLCDDFRNLYVADHSGRGMSSAFKVAAIWSGQEGSLLLWAWLSTFVACSAGWGRCGRATGDRVTCSVLAAIGLFLSVVLIAVANPFTGSTGSGVVQGRGLSPLLQHWAMAVHPPTLFAGYALSAAPLAVLAGALVGRRRDDGWIDEMGVWAGRMWVVLGAGMVLGAWWAYVQLGWGGYWAWDPVENASLMPWLTCTALVHTLRVSRRSAGLRGWIATLAVATFLLCIFGTYVTRSGVVQSVHAFARGPVGGLFLGLLCIAAIGSGTLLLLRRDMLRGERGSSDFRETLVSLGNVCAVLMAAFTLIGTLTGAVSGALLSRPVAMGASFYVRTVGVLGLSALGLMAVATWTIRRDAAARPARGVGLGPVGVGIGGVAVGLALGERSPVALACVAILALGIVSMGRMLAGMMTENLGAARSSAAIGSHLGVLLLAIGVVGSSGWQTKADLTLLRGGTARVGAYGVTLVDVHETRLSDRSVVGAIVRVQPDRGDAFTLEPRRVFFDASEEVGSSVAIRATCAEDVYLALAGWDVGAQRVGVQMKINPLAAWIWVGAGLTLAGCLPMLVGVGACSRRAAVAADKMGACEGRLTTAAMIDRAPVGGLR